MPLRICVFFIFTLTVNSLILPSPFLLRQKRQTETANKATDKENTRCNNPALEKLMNDNIGDDVKQSKLRIMEEAEKVLGGTFNVICAQGDFSYITSTRIFCLTGNESVKCYAFLSDSSRTNDEQQQRRIK